MFVRQSCRICLQMHWTNFDAPMTLGSMSDRGVIIFIAKFFMCSVFVMKLPVCLTAAARKSNNIEG